MDALRRIALGVITILPALGVGRGLTPVEAQLAAPDILVTSAGDSVVAGQSECPSSTLCTLRRAIELANGDPGGVRLTIGFDPVAFPPAAPAVIAVLATPLPPVNRALVSIDGVGAGVIVSGAALPAPGDGLVFAGPAAILTGVAVRDFGGRCVVMSGVNSRVQGIDAWSCSVAVALAGGTSRIESSRLGLGAGSLDVANLSIGVLVTAPDVIVGGAAAVHGNTIGAATTAVWVGEAGVTSFTGVSIEHNLIGRTPGGVPAPVDRGVLLGQPSTRSTVVRNTITNTAKAGIAVAGAVGGAVVDGNRFGGNLFAGLGPEARAIDLGNDGARNANDAGDADTGANGLLNHPIVERVTQAELVGRACAGCTVELYVAAHSPGGAFDYGAQPLAVPPLTADGAGRFVVIAPPVTPGQWVTALATDAADNTSEFGPSTRVGAGVVQCGNVTLEPGWNAAGYFGASPLNLGTAFPDGNVTDGPVDAIYALRDGSEQFDRWLEASPFARTLATLVPGEAYWYLATTPTQIGGGFSLTVPLPVLLVPGWNEFVYVGGGADARDALASLGGKYDALYRFVSAGGGSSRWEAFGNESTPGFVRAFTEVESCRPYRILMREAATLTPLQP